MLSSGAEIARTSLVCQQNGVACESVAYGLSLADKSQQHDIQTRLNHFNLNGKSEQFFKAIVADKAQAAFSGVIKIKEDAQKLKLFN